MHRMTAMPASHRVLRLAASVAALALPFHAIAATTPVGIDALKVYNLIVLRNLTSSSEVEGRTFVGGNLTGSSSNYQISTLPASSYTGAGLVVVGDVTGSIKNINNGAGAVVGGNVSSGFNLNGSPRPCRWAVRSATPTSIPTPWSPIWAPPTPRSSATSGRMAA
jgi:hypothetical protein